MATSDSEDDEIILEAKERFKQCEEWEAPWRPLFDYDDKFANGDSHNMFQWDQTLAGGRQDANKPCLTINKTMQHNLMVINDSKQNKPGVNIRPVGDNASFEAAQIFQEIVRHIEYISNAESVYDHATTFQVNAGMGYWRVNTDFINDKTFDQEIYIKKIKDPRSVYLDPDIDETDGSDARYGFIFEDIPKDLFDSKYPKFADRVGWQSTFNMNTTDSWFTRNMIKVAEYYRRTEKEKRLVSYLDPVSQERIEEYWDKLNEEGQILYKALKEAKHPECRERKVITSNIEWFKIAGNIIVERGPWLGKYIPIVRVVGTETVINGILDRKGHTRQLIDAQKIYNYNSSANVEFIALQTKSPWLASAEAIEGYEEYWNNANLTNKPYLPYNSFMEDGSPIPPPVRPAAPQPSPGYVQGMQIAQNEMMMVTGQYQAQTGENENAKSGIAINARQRQGDRATYHFLDGQSIAIRHTGKILIDLIPKIYDTKRIMRIQATDGSIMNVTIDPELDQAYQKVPPPPGQMPAMDKAQQMIDVIFNPNVGYYDVQSEVGPSFATKRQEAFNALIQIAAENKEFMGIAGDVLWKVADFPEAQILMERWRKVIPPNITGDAPDPQTEQAMKLAADKIEQMTAVIAKQAQEVADKDRELDTRAYEAETNRKTAATNAARLDYEAETKRLVALGNSGEAIKVEQIQPLIRQIVNQMLAAGAPGDQAEGVEGVGDDEAPSEGLGQEAPPGGEQPPIEGAVQGPDGGWYKQQGQQWYQVQPNEQASLQAAE